MNRNYKLHRLLVCLLALCLLLGGCAQTVAPEPSETVGLSPEQPTQGVEQPSAAPEQPSVFNVAFCAIYQLDSSAWMIQMVKELRDYDDAHDEISIKFVEVTDTASYEPQIRALADTGEYGLIVTQFSGHVEATLAVAKDHPEIMFVSQDGMIKNIEQYANVTEAECGDRLASGFLCGAFAATMSKTGSVAFMGGKDILSIQHQAAGWQQGAKYVNAQVNAPYVLADTFSDTIITKELTLTQFSKGVDVVGASCSGATEGVAQAFSETDKSDVYFIALETNFKDLAKGHQIAASIIHHSQMYVSIFEDAMAGSLAMGICRTYGFGDGVNEFLFTDDGTVPDDVKAAIEQIKNDIVSGKIVITTDFSY